MKITVDYKGADKMSKLFTSAIQGEAVNVDKLRLMLEDIEGYKMFFRFYSKKDFMEEYINMFESVSKHCEYITNDSILQRMMLAYKTIFQKPELLYKKLEIVKQIDFYSLEKKLIECLPTNTELEMDIYFVLDGNNGGSIVDEHTMCLDVLFWHTKEEFSKQMEGVILHELHHIGAIYWRNKDNIRKKLIGQKNGIGLAVDLVESILGEGSAFYFFNGDLNMYEIVLEEYGEEFAQGFKNNYCESWNDLDTKIKELDKFLLKLLQNQGEDYSELKKEVSNYTQSKNNKEALDKIIGSHMCSIIDEAFGKENILSGIKNLKEFLEMYNNACAFLSKKGTFSKELIKLWTSVWNL